MVVFPDSPRQIANCVAQLRDANGGTAPRSYEVVEIFDAWGKRLAQSPIAMQPGVVFLCHWLRRATLLSLLRREMESEAIQGNWQNDGSIRLMRQPLGVVGHWPAANVAIQPLLSMSCAALGGNASIVRIPTGLEELTNRVLDVLREVDTADLICSRLCFLAFPSERRDCMEAMASGVDGAMIWGGEEAVLAVRSLPFPHWTRICVFGPRHSVAMMDRNAWTDPVSRIQWCKRLARDVWQFEQRACSSPQVLYVQRNVRVPIEKLLDDLETTFREENRLHPRSELAPIHASSIAAARATWVLESDVQKARFPSEPDWTILAGEGPEYPNPIHNRCLFVQVVDDLVEPFRHFRGRIQTIGLGCDDQRLERAVVDAALRGRVERITWLGRMHVFDSPWDGAELVAPMTRLIRYTPLNKELAVA
jgi:hypothetical protein